MVSTPSSPPARSRAERPSARQMLNKVPEVTAYFWIIKVLATTVGETFGDFLSVTLGLGLPGAAAIVGALLAAVLVLQLRARRYLPPTYWTAVVLISIVGTLITDYLVDTAGVTLPVTTTLFAVLLAATFVAWYASERTLSIHTITTSRREAFYWLTILFTFALGTAAGDLLAERLNLGYALSAVVFAAAIALIHLAHRAIGLGPITAFWAAYVLTRPLGASIGDYLSQPVRDGGLGLGTVTTSVIFLAAILALVGYLTVSRRDATEAAGPIMKDS